MSNTLNSIRAAIDALYEVKGGADAADARTRLLSSVDGVEVELHKRAEQVGKLAEVLTALRLRAAQQELKALRFSLFASIIFFATALMALAGVSASLLLPIEGRHQYLYWALTATAIGVVVACSVASNALKQMSIVRKLLAQETRDSDLTKEQRAERDHIVGVALLESASVATQNSAPQLIDSTTTETSKNSSSDVAEGPEDVHAQTQSRTSSQ